MIFYHNLINWEGMGKVTPCYYYSKRSCNNYIHFKESKLQNKEDYQGESGTLHNDKGVILQEDMTTLNMYSSNKGALKKRGKNS